MKDFAESDVAFNPAITVSAGLSSNLVVSEHQENPKSKINPLKRPLSRTDHKKATLQGILEQMTRSNDLKQRLEKSKEK
jgi:hypothetical protein